MTIFKKRKNDFYCTIHETNISLISFYLRFCPDLEVVMTSKQRSDGTNHSARNYNRGLILARNMNVPN